jgi:Aspartyl protease
MRINGKWFQCDDGVTRPILTGEVLSRKGTWEQADFLLDIGADRTVISSELLSNLGLGLLESHGRLSGLGGLANVMAVQTEIRFRRDDGYPILFRGQFAAVIDPEALDMSILGRDITDLFAAIIDRPGNVVCLLGQHHQYRIENQPS